MPYPASSSAAVALPRAGGRSPSAPTPGAGRSRREGACRGGRNSAIASARRARTVCMGRWPEVPPWAFPLSTTARLMMPPCPCWPSVRRRPGGSRPRAGPGRAERAGEVRPWRDRCSRRRRVKALLVGGGSARLRDGDRAQERRRGAEAYGGPARNQMISPVRGWRTRLSGRILLTKAPKSRK